MDVLLMGGSVFSFLEKYLMFGKGLPSWAQVLILVIGVVAVFNSTLNLASTYFRQRATVSAETGGIAIGQKAETGPIESKPKIAAPKSATGNAKVYAAEKIEDHSRHEDNRRQTNVFALINVVNGGDGGIDAAVYDADIKTPDGTQAKVEVHVLWKEASWHFGKTTFNRGKLVEYLRTADYRRAMTSATAIACVGLSSYWSDAQNTTPVSTLTNGSQRDVEDTTDNRAFTLCKLLSERAKELDARPQFAGMGLGYHVDQPSSKSEEQQQRALVILHIKSAEPKNLTPAQLQGILVEVMKSKTIEQFQGHRYSRVVDGRPICWTHTFHGTFIASELKCAD